VTVLPWETVERATAPDGIELILARRGAEWVVRAGGRALMSSRVHGSEEALARLALARWRARPRPPHQAASAAPTVLLGGLGMGFTLRALLDGLPGQARVVVAELVPALVAWNRGPLAELAGRPLDDPRVRLQHGDVASRIAEAERAFDAIVLDVDNGPAALAHRGNQRLYGDDGLRACHRALRAGGVLAVWSAGPAPRFLEAMDRAGFEAAAEVAPARSGGGLRHAVLLGVRRQPGR
jgi:hypothetical protein